MKKLIYFSAIALLLSVVSCSTENDAIDNVNNETGGDNLSSEVTGGCDTLSAEVEVTNDFNGATVYPSGGQAPYTYYWDNSSTGTSLGSDDNDFSVGIYNVWVTDDNNCIIKRSFEITYVPPTLTASIECIGSDQAVIAIDITNRDNSLTVEAGICFSLNPSPSINDETVVFENIYHSNDTNMGNLSLGTTYYVRSYLQYENEIFYSNEISFTTKSEPSPYYIGQRFGGGIIAHINCDGVSGFIICTDVYFDSNSLSQAEDRCEALVYEGYDDWYLPTANQLKEMDHNLHRTGIYTFETGTRIYDNYWSNSSAYSSSACGGKEAFHYDFDMGDYGEGRLPSCYHLNFIHVRNF